MQSFEWIDATSVEQAVTLLVEAQAAGTQVAVKAGGVDLLDLMKEGIVLPTRVVNLKSIPRFDGIGFDEKDGLQIDALVTLARIADDSNIQQYYPAFADAAAHAATPQVRNAASIAGNLLQRPRCWYFRNRLFHDLPGNKPCYAREGENQYHAIFDNTRTAMVQASTPATALVAYKASVDLVGPQRKERNVLLSDFFIPPEMRAERDTLIARDELLVRVRVPTPAPGTRAAYHKQTERESYDWPLCDVAVVLTMDDQIVRDASIVLGWVAPTPRHASESEQLLKGKTVSQDLAAEAARAAVADATPLSKNGYKVPLLESVVRRTILAAALAPATPARP
jgi:xanthine dehydrogenase YagS FAD-binding subunit